MDGPGHGPRWNDLPPEQLAEIIAALRAEGREHQTEAEHARRLADQLEAQLVALQQADRRRRKAAWLTRMWELGLVAAIGTAAAVSRCPGPGPGAGTSPAGRSRAGAPPTARARVRVLC